MRSLAIILSLAISIGIILSDGSFKPRKRNVGTNTTAVSIKLAEAKAVLSKNNIKKIKGTLSTADGGI